MISKCGLTMNSIFPTNSLCGSSNPSRGQILAFLVDGRSEYGEVRYRAWGLIDGRAHCLAFTDRDGRIRAISLRRAHQKEMRRHVPKAP